MVKPYSTTVFCTLNATLPLAEHVRFDGQRIEENVISITWWNFIGQTGLKILKSKQAFKRLYSEVRTMYIDWDSLD
jgi:hypothetical protein